ncbi:helix-turn-helix domain-containing protein [Peptostreptococcus sp.]|uniref:helix-turn-helix domain-containing protein n=1 Tax=Peptostreptococcus sp. TaxID=1262 RepID=UPI001DCA3E6C|nr:helix-turn-helix transcriptional regulator [Peptostreptococcus sp.]MBS5596856.1 helix-turn-helix transcriptional regulator [Peptostreptococcus sp.]
MTIENQLRELILLKHGSLREFTFNIGIPYSTLSTILKKGIMTATMSNMVKICNALDIKLDELVAGRIVENKPSGILLDVEDILNRTKNNIAYPNVKIDGKIMDESTKKLLINSIDLSYQLALKMLKNP